MDAPTRRGRNRIAVACALLPLTVMLSACVPEPSPPVPPAPSAPPATPAPAGNAPGILTYEVDADRVAMLALSSGVLVFENGCLGLRDGTLLVFPDDSSSWDGSTLRYSGVDFRPGDEIGFGGGQSSLTPELSESFDIPEECGDGPVWFVAPGLLEN